MTSWQITLDARLAPVWRDAFDASTAMWSDIVGPDFEEIALGAPKAVVPLDEFLTLPGIPSGWNPLAGAADYGSAGYVGVPYDPSGLISAGWTLGNTLAHELGHLMGFRDQQDSGSGLFDYGGNHELSAANVEFAQARHGADDGNNRIEVFGNASGTMSGGHGADSITGADGAERIYGNQGSDFLTGGGNADTLYGGQDADTLSGGDGNDVLYGNLGNDVLVGGDGLDSLFGGQGSDTLIGGAGDVLVGGLGGDTFITEHPDTITDFNAEQGDVIVPLLGQHLPDNHDWIGV